MNTPVTSPDVPRQATPRAPASNSDSNSGEGARRGRGRPVGSQPKNRPEIPDDMFVIVAVPEEDRGQFKRRREERSAKQQAADKMVMDVYKEWKALGQPRVWGRMPIKDWPLPPNLVESALFLLGKAAGLHGLKLYFGQKGVIKEENGKKVYHLTFCVVSKRVKVEGAPEQ